MERAREDGPEPAQRRTVHLFHVHSDITRLVARSVARQLALDDRDVVTVWLRGYRPGRGAVPPGRTVARRWSVHPETLPSPWVPLAARLRLAAFDADLDRLCLGHPFHAYVPQTHARFVQATITHPRCVGFSVIEEGMASYYEAEALHRLLGPADVPVRDQELYGGRIGPWRFVDSGYVQAWATSPRAFPGRPRREVLPDLFADAAQRPPAGCTTVLALGSTVAYAHAEHRPVMRALARAMSALRARGVRRLHVKVHPAQVEVGDDRRALAELGQMAGGIEIVRLDDHASIEGMVAHDPGITVVVGISSLAIYAAALGAEVWSYARLMADEAPHLGPYLDQLPAVFADSVTFLEDPRRG